MNGRLKIIEGFGNVNIQRDLTYRQRHELSAKRRQSRVIIVDNDVNLCDRFVLVLVKQDLLLVDLQLVHIVATSMEQRTT